MRLPPACEGCPLHNPTKNFVPVSGRALKRVLIIGEAPGEQEAQQGVPFVGASGKLLDHLLKLAGLERDDFAVHNVLSCRPPNNELRGQPYERNAIAHCEQHLEHTIRTLAPKVIIALGNTPLEALCGVSGITRYRGYPLRGPQNTWVVPTFHPSYLLPRRGQKSTSHLTPAVVRDFQLAIEIAQQGYERLEPTYLEDPSPQRATGFYNEWVAAGCPPLSVDIETPYKLVTKDEEGFDTLDTQVIRIGYCFRAGYAMSIPYTAEYMWVHTQLLSHEATKVVWNGYHFDMPILQEVGNPLRGNVIDAMWAWHYLQPDLPRGLESVGSFFFRGLPWKHLSKDSPARYNAIDADVALQNWEGTERGLRKRGQYDGFIQYLVELDPFLQEAGANGVHINARARRALYKKLRKEEKRILALIQPLVPQELRPRKHYKRFPQVHHNKRAIEEVVVPGTTKVCSVCGVCGVTKSEHTSKKGGKRGVPLNACYKAAINVVSGQVVEWNVVMDYNPLSPDQLIAYCVHFAHPIGKNAKSGAQSVDDTHLQVLEASYGSEHPIYALVGELRTVRKSLSTYVEGLRPDANGVVRTQYTYAPASGRLSSKGLQRGSDRGVNLQNIPHRGDHPYASDIRAMIVPPPGYVFVEADSSAIEAVMTGYFMQDAEYIKLAQDGIHDAFALKTLGLPNTPEERAAFKKRSKVKGSTEELLRERKKKTVHGCLTGDHEVLTPQGWVPLATYKYDVPIAEWDAATQWITFRVPTKGVDKQYVGEMLHLKGTTLDVLCTPDHRMPVWTSQHNIQEYTAQTLPKANSVPLVGQLQEPTPLDTRLLQLAVATQADGRFVNKRIKFRFRRERKIARLLRLLTTDEYKLVVYKDGVTQITLLPALSAQVKQFLTPQKALRWELLQQDARSALDECLHWDGHQKGAMRTYSSTNLQSAEVLQALAHINGREALLRCESQRPEGRKPLHMLHFNRRTASSLKCITRNSVPFDGRIYCPTTSTGYFLARRNGKVFVSGNTSYGMGERLMAYLYPKVFKSITSAKAEIAAFYDFVPKLKAWHHETRVQAHQTTYLQLPLGNYRRYFYDVFSYVRDKAGNIILRDDGSPKIKLGEDGKACIAQKPQGTAGMFMRRNAKDIAQYIKAKQLPFILSGNFLCHDSYLVCVPDNPPDILRAVDMMEHFLCRPIPEMDNLRIGCEIKVGRDWDAMETVRTVRV